MYFYIQKILLQSSWGGKFLWGKYKTNDELIHGLGVHFGKKIFAVK